MIHLIFLIYNLLITPLWPIIRLILTLTDPKFRSSWKERLTTPERIARLRKEKGAGTPVLWIHAASMGEFEQARPVISEVRRRQMPCLIVVTFMSPSGYEPRKSYPEADLVCYLPVDTLWHVEAFYRELRPATGLISRYEFWPNLLIRSAAAGIPLILMNGSLKAEHPYGTWYASWFYKPLFGRYSRILTVSDHHTAMYRAFLGQDAPVTTAGDTRYDQVLARAESTDADMEFLRDPTRLTLILGSAWPADLTLWLSAIRALPASLRERLRLWVVPHEIHPGEEKQVTAVWPETTLSLWSAGPDPAATVLWVDVMGRLMKLYGLGDAAYVGGGFGVHIHNILEPAVWGIPVSHGPRYSKSPEAMDMQRNGLTTVISTPADATVWLTRLLEDPAFRQTTGTATRDFILNYRGSTTRIVDVLRDMR
ncbi:MAG: hypothetical protein HUU10_13065 [Bacteroidetes bacterium]|nr:hypothetical protein [Bacteroidota bacterium]